MITSTSRSATIARFRPARRITPVVPKGPTGGRAARRRSHRPADESPARRDVHEGRGRALSDQDLARDGPRPADLGEGREVDVRHRHAARAGQFATTRPRDPRGVRPRARRSTVAFGRARPPRRWPRDDPPHKVGSRSAIGGATSSANSGGRRGARARSDAANPSAGAATGPGDGRPSNEGSTSAWMSRIASATLAAAS